MKPILIVGGGLAGLTLGIGLRQVGVPVTLLEAGQYPRHRVCGEFISGRGQRVLTDLGLAESLHHAGMQTATTVRLVWAPTRELEQALPESAWCLSRFLLDELLAREFRRLGGELRERERCRQPELAEGAVRATGRSAQPVADGWRSFALKVHARNVALKADLELHLVPSGYVGLCQLGGGLVNICGFFRSKKTEPDLAERWLTWLSGPLDSPLHARLRHAEVIQTSFCSIAGISLKPKRAVERAQCCIGDALTMIPPVTGNGMSIAFESAQIAVGPLAAYSRNETTWRATQQEIARRCDAAFATRLRWAHWLQQTLFHPSFHPAFRLLQRNNGRCWRALYARLR